MEPRQMRDLIEGIREKIDIYDVIGRRVQLDRRGRGLCPFHQDKNPSFSVNAHGRYFHCFGCGAGGDVFRFIELYEKKTFWEALSDLAREAGVPPPSVSSDDRCRIDEERRIEDVLKATADFYHESLTGEARRYLTEDRGFTEDTIRRFKIGWAGGRLKKGLIQDLKFSEEICLKAGVLKQADGKPVVSVVTDVDKFIRHYLEELDARLHNPVQIRGGGSVFEILSKLAEGGLELAIEGP